MMTSKFELGKQRADQEERKRFEREHRSLEAAQRCRMVTKVERALADDPLALA
jgi:hypothetical protein